MNELNAIAWIACNYGLGMTVGELAKCMSITRRQAGTLINNLHEQGLLIACKHTHGKTYTYRYVLSKEAQDTICKTAEQIKKVLL